VIAESLIDGAGVGRPLSDRALQRQRSIESYLRGEMLPRYIQRAAEIERGTRDHERELRLAYRELREVCGDDPAAFARRWSDTARHWNFNAVNRLVQQHNDWYPIERDLPMDPRTGDYVPVCGRHYRREELGPDWILERFPA
jgi:hypothetical protein